jgi:hypothetical protein
MPVRRRKAENSVALLNVAFHWGTFDNSQDVASAIFLHTLPVSAQRDYNAVDAEGWRETSAKPLESTSIQHQANVRQMADAPDSKTGPRTGGVGSSPTF